MLFGFCYGIWFPEDSTLRLLSLFHLVVGEVCGPATPHFLYRISSSIGFCLALTHSSWSDFWTGQNIFNILRMDLLTGTWSWCMKILVSFQVSQNLFLMVFKFNNIQVWSSWFIYCKNGDKIWKWYLTRMNETGRGGMDIWLAWGRYEIRLL